jgi:hypothetical protein
MEQPLSPAFASLVMLVPSGQMGLQELFVQMGLLIDTGLAACHVESNQCFAANSHASGL